MRRNRIRLTFFSSLFIGVIIWQCAACYRKPGTDDVATAMVDLSKSKNYDRAIQIGKDWLRSHENDSTMYQQVGIVYLLKARSDPLQREESLHLVVDAFDKSLAVAPDEPSVVHQAARGFEIVGEMANVDQRCGYYRKAKVALDHEAALLVAQRFIPKAQNFQIPPRYEAHANAVARVTEKMAQVSCTLGSIKPHPVQ